MMRLVALLLLALLGRPAVEGLARRAEPGGTASWNVAPSSPSQVAPRVATALPPAERVAPHGVPPFPGATPSFAGTALHASGATRSPTRAVIRAFSLAAVTSGARRVAFPYDAIAPPRRA